VAILPRHWGLERRHERSCTIQLRLWIANSDYEDGEGVPYFTVAWSWGLERRHERS
jgi:hypothetical protein